METQERRNVNRWWVDRQAKVKLEGAVACADCHLKDINFKGCQIVFGLRLQKDTFLRLLLFLSEEFVLNVEAWIVWHKVIEGHNLYGLYFSKITDSDKEKVYQFMRRNFPQRVHTQWYGREKEGGGKMQEAEFKDKRIFARVSADLPLRFLDLNANQEGKARTQDLSAKGLGLVTDRELPAGTDLEIWLEIPESAGPVYTRGKVVWSSKAEEGKIRAGVNLEKADFMGLSKAYETRKNP